MLPALSFFTPRAVSMNVGRSPTRRVSLRLNSPPNDLIVHRAIAPFEWPHVFWLDHHRRAGSAEDSQSHWKPQVLPSLSWGFFFMNLATRYGGTVRGSLEPVPRTSWPLLGYVPAVAIGMDELLVLEDSTGIEEVSLTLDGYALCLSLGHPHVGFWLKRTARLAWIVEEVADP